MKNDTQIAVPDSRHISNGREIPTESYSDQPYIVKTDDGAWLCVVTTGSGHEGAPGQHVVSMRSTDKGRTWSKPVDVEPVDGPEASYAVILKTPSGRIYCFYNHNTDRVREVKRHDGQAPYKRVDSLGHFVFKYSDDHGRSWSARRYDIPVREFACDRDNVYGGKLRFFWNVGKPFVLNGAAFVSLHKVGKMGRGFFAQSEGALLKSANLLTEKDPEKIVWETLPDGDIGLRPPQGGGPIAEEQSYSLLSDGSFFCVYRTVAGHPAHCYSRDGGHTWSAPQYLRYADGRLVKHPRAANFAWRCANGKFLYWFHNHGGRFIGEAENALVIAYEDRNPVWLSGGIEADSPEGRIILWSEPEIVLYDDDPFIRMSYPDLVEEEGKYYLTETQKDIARVHEISADLLEGMWHSLEKGANGRPLKAAVATAGTILNLPEQGKEMPVEAPLRGVPAFRVRDTKQLDMRGAQTRRGFALDLWMTLDSFAPGQILLDNRSRDGQGFCLQTASGGVLEIVLNDGQTENRWACDPVLQRGKRHHVVVNVDGGPHIISFIIDGRFCDGGEWRQFGWGRFSPNLRHVQGANVLRIAPWVQGRLHSLRVYNRILRTAEAVGDFYAWA